MAVWNGVLAGLWWVLLALVAALAGCGDSSVGGSSVSPQPPGYNGITSQAEITLKSAEEISSELFVRTQSQESLSGIEGLDLTDDGLDLPDDTVGVPEKGARAEVQNRGDIKSYVIYGPCGGSQTVVTDIDTVTGEVALEVTYDSFCIDGITKDGGYSQSVDSNGDGLFAGDIRLTYTLYTVKEPSGTQRYEGALHVVWTVDHISRTFDYVVTNLTTGLAVQYVDFQIETDVSDTEVTWTQAGRFYHSLYGYVDVTTESVNVADPGLELPHQGRIEMSGAATGGGAAFGWFEVFEDGYRVTVDTDGDGGVDGDSGLLPWGLLPLP